MQRKRSRANAIAAVLLILTLLVVGPRHGHAQDAKSPYPSMAPLEQYLIPRDAEMALARSAAPDSISRDADVMVLGRHGYLSAAKGTNGFVCMVWRSWAAGIDDPEFWNPKLRAPICLNPAAARFNVPLTVKKTELILAGRTKTQMVETISSALDKKELPSLEPGAMCYMQSRQAYLSDKDPHWHPHVMFFVPLTEPADWGADLPGSPFIAAKAPADRLTIFLLPVKIWSDGTPDPTTVH